MRDPTSPSVKPRDLGNGRVCASFAPDGGWLSLGSAHPVHGFVELNGLPRFDPSWRGDPVAVRRYRALMVEDRYTFLRVESAGVVQVEASVSATEPAIAASYQIDRVDRDNRPVVIHFRGRLDRHAYAEITDVSPLASLNATNRLWVTGSQLRVEAPNLPATATITVHATDGHADGWTRVDSRGAEMVVDWGDADQMRITMTCSLDTHQTRLTPAPDVREGERRALQPAGGSGHLRVPPTLRPRLAGIVRDTIAYILGCTALRVAEREICIVTDHRILPLSWTRDAYYQALLLLCAARREPRAARTVADHLRWLWYRSRDSSGSWMRSHLTNGPVKDHGLQADQQLYPILELCDYRRVTGSWPDPATGPAQACPEPAAGQVHACAEPASTWGRIVAKAWTQLPRDQRTGLLASQENPADDPSGMPYTLSTQILYWYTAVRLHEWQSELDLGALTVAATARRIKTAFEQHFTVAGPFGTQWAYESDLRGGRRLYNDANDLPTALAPLWGFCAPNAPQWAATMRYTFSEHNAAYHAGAYGGLGSAHTPGTWPLGDIQRWVAASLLGHHDQADAAISRLTEIAADDGLLPETYDSDTGAWQARHWFAWPSAALGAVYLSGNYADTPWRLTGR